MAMANIEDDKPTKDVPSGSKIYTVGDVGAGAQVAQGEYIQQVKNVLAGMPDGDILEKQFDVLMESIAQTPHVDEETRDLALEKTKPPKPICKPPSNSAMAIPFH
jgi:hypothetical protein